MKNNEIKLSIVIGCYNQLSILKKVLPFYEKQRCSKSAFEVIIMDSSSNDGTDVFMNTYSPTFNLIYNVKENTGKASARNEGTKIARGDILLITDADMIPDHNFVQSHLEAHSKAKEPCCFEGLAWNLSSLDWPPKEGSLSPQVGKNPKHMSKLGWYYFLTGNLSFPKEIFEKEKGFNEIFDGYGWEDLELGYRITQKHIPIFYLKTAINYHYHIITKDDEIKRCVKKGESSKIFLKLHPELKWFLGLNPLSRWLFPRIKQNSLIFKFFQSCYENKTSKLNGLGFWFLKEFFYLKGALNF